MFTNFKQLFSVNNFVKLRLFQPQLNNFFSYTFLVPILVNNKPFFQQQKRFFPTKFATDNFY